MCSSTLAAQDITLLTVRPKEVVELDQKLNVVILDFDDEKKRIALGLKQLTPHHRWTFLTLKVATKVKGKVVAEADYGIHRNRCRRRRFDPRNPTLKSRLDERNVSLWVQRCVYSASTDAERLPHKFEIAAGVELDPQEFKNVVVSHKALIEAELEQQKKEIIGKLEKGQVLEGTVKNITSYGVFIDLGGVDGLIHITDLSWGRVSDPKEVVELDQKLNVVILDFDDEKKRIALGLKQLTPHPWDALDTDLKVGDKVKGKVVVMADYGAFIEIATGVEGLIHVSEMSWSHRNVG